MKGKQLAEFTPRILAGRYEVGELIGRGGMAEVHVGKDTRLGRTVAIKLLRSDLAKDPAFQTRFRREAQAAASLNHPAIVSVYDTGEDVTVDPAGQTHHLPFIIMEYVEGHTLRELMRDGAALPIDEATDITVGVLSALQYAHHAGIVHRDIKPANIMLTVTGQVKVMDFGIARALAETSETITQTQAVIGTAQYLSPEQARGENVDARSDLYSTGCVLFELLTGAPPFVGDSAVSVAYQHVREAAVPPSTKAPDVPAVLDQIVLKALAKDRNFRYSTASEFLADLEAAKQGRGVSAPPVGPATAATQLLAPTAATAAAAPMSPTPAGGLTGVLPSDEELEEEAERARTKKKRIIIISVIAGVALIVLGILLFMILRGGGDEPPADAVMVEVPAVPESRSEDDAKAVLEEAKFKTERKEEVSEDIEEGKVTRFDPESGQKAEEGSTVVYFVSLGSSALEVPDVASRSQDEARQMLEAAGLEVASKVETADSPTVPKDNVVKTDPAAGQTVKRGATITLYVSTGNNVVPDCAGQTQSECTNALQAAGFTVGDISDQTSEAAPGTVIATSPAAGSTAAQGSPVSIVIARAPDMATVPAVAGLTVGQAKTLLVQAGLVPNVVGDTGDDAKVVAVDPAPDTKVEKGSTVTIRGERPPPPPSPTASP
ncbi:MAG: Stk1 family PASTA domain-containing Ser/Thr kinase [Micrococcales bacterium]|nr:Stk1 family PASTA domain-containing Ser/Thr kinase [Micrococcales bacterium]